MKAAGLALLMAGVAGAALAEEVTGDAAYGEYLAGECTGCHRADGADEGIPSIIGLPPKAFVEVMAAYREKRLEHPVMNMVAGRLDDTALAALAVYFESLGTDGDAENETK